MKITIKNLQKRIPIHSPGIKKAILRLLASERPGAPGEIAVYFVSDAEIKKLNKSYLKKDRATDVLAFDLKCGFSPGIFADIFVSTDTAVTNAAFYATSAQFEARLYCLHGLLHILGYDDHSAKAAKLMRKKEAVYVHRSF